MLSFLITAIMTLWAAFTTSVELIWTQGTQEQYAQDIKAIQTDISALQRATTMAIRNGPTPIGPLSYAHIAATIPTMPQAIKQSTYKPTKVHEITVRIGNTTNCKETLKQNN